MSVSIPKPLIPGKDSPENPLNLAVKASKSPQQIASILEQPPEPTRAPFSSFFTLITDTNTSTTYHPGQVHYVFSDDDPEILTNACLAALSPPSPSTSIQSPQPFSTSSSSTSAGPSSKKPSSKSHKQQQAPTTATKEAALTQRDQRTIILTLSESGDTIVSAHSLTPTWQILNTEITTAPTWDVTNAEGTSHAGGLMLKIEGTDGSAIEETAIPQTPVPGGCAGKPLDLHTDAGGIDMQALMESFDAKMSMLRKVIEAGGSKQINEL